MTSTALQSKEKLNADLRAAINDMQTLINAGPDEAEGDALALRERVRSSLEAARGQINHFQADVRSRAREVALATDHHAREHPWQWVGGAAALGLALGVLIGRR